MIPVCCFLFHSLPPFFYPLMKKFNLLYHSISSMCTACLMFPFISCTLSKVSRSIIGSWTFSTRYIASCSEVLFFFACKKIRSVSFLHQYFSNVLLVAQHSVNSGGAPLRFSSDRFDSMRPQILFDFSYPIVLDVQLKNLSDNLSLLRGDFQLTVWAFRVAKELRVVQNRLTASHAVADTELNILTGATGSRLDPKPPAGRRCCHW